MKIIALEESFRLDPAHTPPVETRRADLDGLRQVFPGFGAARLGLRG